MLAQDLTIVTNSWSDFRPMVQREEVHPGMVVILPSARRERPVELFTEALLTIREHRPALDMVNTVLEVDAEGTVTMYRIPEGS